MVYTLNPSILESEADGTVRVKASLVYRVRVSQTTKPNHKKQDKDLGLCL